jgi:hypothetical protein
MYKLAVNVDQHVSVQKADTSGKIRMHRRKRVGGSKQNLKVKT